MKAKSDIKIFFLTYLFVQIISVPVFSQVEKIPYTTGIDQFRLVANCFTSLTSFQSNWLALDIEYSYLEPLQVIKYMKNGKWHKRRQFATSGRAWGHLGVEYNVEHKNFGIRMGAIQNLSLFSFNPVQFIYNTGSNTKGFTYRPEIGIGYWRFQLNYAYNINFKKEINVMGKHLLVFRFHFPF